MHDMALAEEADITRYMYENAKRLGMKRADREHALRYHRYSLNRFFAKRGQMGQLINSEEYKVIVKYFSNDGKTAASKLVELVNDRTARWTRMADWYNATAKKFREEKE